MSIDRLQFALASSLEAGLSTFVVIDPMLGEPLPLAIGDDDDDDDAVLAQIRESVWQRAVHAVPLAQGVALPPHLHPYLVELQGPADPWLAGTVEMAHAEWHRACGRGLESSGMAAHRIGAWVQTSLSAPALAAAIGGMLKVNTEAKTPARYLRLADRRVIGWLQSVVGPSRVASQLGRIHSWRYLDCRGELACVRSGGESAQPLRLTSDEWHRFMQGEQIHPTVARWLGQLAVMERPDLLPPSETACHQRAQTALAQADLAARRWPQRFVQPADAVAWAALSLVSPLFDTHRDVLALLNAQPDSDDGDHHSVDPLDTLCAQLGDLSLKAETT